MYAVRAISDSGVSAAWFARFLSRSRSYALGIGMGLIGTRTPRAWSNMVTNPSEKTQRRAGAACPPRPNSLCWPLPACDRKRSYDGPQAFENRYAHRRRRDDRPRRRFARGEGFGANRGDRRRRRTQLDARRIAIRNAAGRRARPASSTASTTCSTSEANSRSRVTLRSPMRMSNGSRTRSSASMPIFRR